jgi:hypothetical protein
MGNTYKTKDKLKKGKKNSPKVRKQLYNKKWNIRTHKKEQKTKNEASKNNQKISLVFYVVEISIPTREK